MNCYNDLKFTKRDQLNCWAGYATAYDVEYIEMFITLAMPIFEQFKNDLKVILS